MTREREEGRERHRKKERDTHTEREREGMRYRERMREHNILETKVKIERIVGVRKRREAKRGEKGKRKMRDNL